MAEGDVQRDQDTILIPVVVERTDEHGNTVVVGYPPSVNEYWTGTPSTSPDGPGLGIGGPETEGA